MKIEFDAPAIHQPSMVHEVERLGMMVISKDQDKVVTFSTLIPPIDLSYGRKMAVPRNKSDGDVFFFFLLKKVMVLSGYCGGELENGAILGSQLEDGSSIF